MQVGVMLWELQYSVLPDESVKLKYLYQTSAIACSVWLDARREEHWETRHWWKCVKPLQYETLSNSWPDTIHIRVDGMQGGCVNVLCVKNIDGLDSKVIPVIANFNMLFSMNNYCH